jgi:hypothetical protein
MFDGLPVAGNSVEAFAEAVAVAVKRNKSRPFAAFRGDFRRPVRRRAKPGTAGMDRLYAANIVPDRSSNVAKLQRGLRIMKRVEAAAVAEASQ